jgi:cation:H+ antiporter
MTVGLMFAGALVLIVVAAELFTNAVEWAGFRMKLASGATGSLLAAIGTALPEVVVPIVALIGREPSATAVASGAVLGSPFLLLGVGVGITGLAVLMRKQRSLRIDPRQARRDLGFFIPAFSVVLIGIVLPAPVRLLVGLGLLVSYGLYARATLRGGAPAEDLPEPLHLLRGRREPATWAVAVQLLVSVAMLIVGSDIFVKALNDTAAALHANPLILALIVVPLATELPEMLNSVLWVRSGDDGLAFGNVAGAAVFQACFLGFVGLVFTPWRPGFNGVLSGVLTLVVAAVVLVMMRNGVARGRWLLLAGLPWVGYVILVVATGGRLGG